MHFLRISFKKQNIFEAFDDVVKHDLLKQLYFVDRLRKRDVLSSGSRHHLQKFISETKEKNLKIK